MFGLDPITLPSLMILAGYAVQCEQPAPTKINIIPRTEDVEYDPYQTLKQIQNYDMDTVDPYAFHGNTITQGFMKGKVALKQKIKFGHSVNKQADYACVWYKDITVELHIDPTIVIAKELYRDNCMRKAITRHELKHVRVDREIVNKYAKSMGAKLLSELKSRGFKAGPIPRERVKEVMAKMERVVGQILELEYQKLGIERQEKQRTVDTLEEYESVDDKCPHFEKKKQKIYADALK